MPLSSPWSRDQETLFQLKKRIVQVLIFEATNLLESHSHISTFMWRPRFPGNKRTKGEGRRDNMYLASKTEEKNCSISVVIKV